MPNRPSEDKGNSNLKVLTWFYSNKFVMAVLRNGKPQKELANGVVKIPFGEYALRFRNKNNRRALVKFFIDGEEASGTGYVIDANSSVDIERWATKAVKFKFVSLDSEDAVDFGKNGPNEDKVKGTIEARFYLEKEQPTFTIQPAPEVHHHHHHYPKPRPWYNPTPIWHVNDNSSWPNLNNPYQGPAYTTCGGVAPTVGTYSSNSVSPDGTQPGGKMYRRKVTRSAADNTLKCSSMTREQQIDAIKMDIIANNPCILGVALNESTPVQDGCTVEGSHSSQTFRTVSFEAETDYVAVKVFLQGYDEEPKGIEIRSQSNHKVILEDLPAESEEDRRIREAQAENARLLKELEDKKVRDEKNAILRKLEDENRKLREALGI